MFFEMILKILHIKTSQEQQLEKNYIIKMIRQALCHLHNLISLHLFKKLGNDSFIEIKMDNH